MKILSIACALLLTASIASADSALDRIIDRPFKNDHVTDAMIRSNGTLYVVLGGNFHSGTWQKKNGKFCRSLPSLNLNGCQNVVSVINSKGQFIGIEIRDPGKDSGNRYFLK